MSTDTSEVMYNELHALRQRIVHMERVEERLLRKNEELDALYNTTLALMNRLDLSEVLQSILERAGQLVETRHGCIAIAEYDEAAITFKAVMGVYEQFPGYRMYLGEGMAGKVWQTRMPLIVDDYDTWDGHSARFAGAGLKALVGIPLLVRGQAIGILSLAYLEPGQTFDNETVSLLERFACLAALALENARLYTAAQSELAQRKRAEEINRAQFATLRELSTPLIPISNHVVAMPLIGAIDTWRAQQIMDMMLQGIEQYHAQIAILDITGVAVIDAHVADALIRTAQAVQLLGAQIVVTGIRPDVAQTLVALGVDLSCVVTCRNFQSGIAYAMQAYRTMAMAMPRPVLR